MTNKFLKLFFLILLNTLVVFAISAQTIESCSYIDRMPGDKPLSPHLRDRMIELCIEDNKKEYKELIENSEEVAKLSKELGSSFDEKKTLSSDDREKLKEVESLLKKIRKELSADDDDDDDDEPLNTLQAIKDLQEKTTFLLVEVKKITRHTISTAAIQSSNAVLKIVKFLRFKN